MAEALPLGAQEAGGGGALMGKLRMADRGMMEVLMHTFMKMRVAKVSRLTSCCCTFVAGDFGSSRWAGEDRQSQLPLLRAAHTLEVQQDSAHCFQGLWLYP